MDFIYTANEKYEVFIILSNSKKGLNSLHGQYD